MVTRSKWYLRPLQLAPLAAFALLIPTPIVGHDSWLHLIWLEQFAGLIHDGIVYPRWLPLSNGGFGSPTFYFYPPLAAYLGSVLALLDSSVREIDLFRFVAYIGTIGSILSFRYYLKTLGIDKKIAWAGALFYAMLPYRAVDLILRNALGEHLAFVWIPIVFVGVEGLRDPNNKQRAKALLRIAVGFALLLLTNIPTSIAVAIAIPIYSIIRYERSWQALLVSVAGLLVGALLTSFYLLPALSLQDQIQSFHLWDAGTSKTGAAFTISDFFAKPSNPVTNANGVMLLGGIAALVLVSITWRTRKKQIEQPLKGNAPVYQIASEQQRILISWGSIATFALVLQIPIVLEFVYQLPVVSYLQFSWRWNILLVPAIATIFPLLYSAKQSTVLVISAVFAVTTIAIVVTFNSKYEDHHSPDLLKVEYSDAFEYMPVTTMRGTHSLAKFVGKHRTDPPVLLEGLGAATVIEESGDTREYQIDLIQPARATFHMFHWPLWQLEIDGKPAAITPDSLGRATAHIPAGRSRVRLSRIMHESESIGGWLSLSAMLLVAGGYVFTQRKQIV